MNPIRNLHGQVFGELYVVRRTTSDQNGRAMWICICTCGKAKVIRGNNLMTGNSKTCGCRGKRG